MVLVAQVTRDTTLKETGIVCFTTTPVRNNPP
jgi:hypothetical protein